MLRMAGVVGVLLLGIGCAHEPGFHVLDDGGEEGVWQDQFIDSIDTGMGAYASLENGAYTGDVFVRIPADDAAEGEGEDGGPWQGDGAAWTGQVDLVVDAGADLHISGHGTLFEVEGERGVEVWVVGVSDDPPFYTGELALLLDGVLTHVPWHGVSYEEGLLAQMGGESGDFIAFPAE